MRDAERAAARAGAELVVFSGRNEAGHMRSLWHGPDVELVVDETATTTAENAAHTLPTLLERDVSEAIVVCAPGAPLRVCLSSARAVTVKGAPGVKVMSVPGSIGTRILATHG